MNKVSFENWKITTLLFNNIKINKLSIVVQTKNNEHLILKLHLLLKLFPVLEILS